MPRAEAGGGVGGEGGVILISAWINDPDGIASLDTSILMAVSVAISSAALKNCGHELHEHNATIEAASKAALQICFIKFSWVKLTSPVKGFLDYATKVILLLLRLRFSCHMH